MVDEILIRFSVKDDGTPVIEKVNKSLGETTKQSKALAPGLENAREKMTGFLSTNAALIGVLVGVGLALKDVIETGIEYAMTVDNMVRAGGESAEETSRFIQVLDDYEISAEEALAATRALTKNGLAPNIDTLAKLSDQYRSLNSAEEKNAFIIENLGRGGLQWAKALDQGSVALRAQAAAVSQSLILSQDQIDSAEQARLAIDEWNDSIEGLKVTLSMGLLPIFAAVVTSINNNIKAGFEWKDLLRAIAPVGLVMLINDIKEAYAQNTEAMEDATFASVTLADTQAQLEEKEKAAAEAAKALSEVLSGRIGLINSIQSAEESYTEKSQSLNDQRIQAEQDLAKFRAQGYWEQSEQIQGSLKKLDEIKQAEADLAKEREKQTLQFISDILAQNLARDGWTENEFAAFADQQVAWGLWSEDVVAKAKAAWSEADKITQSINAIPTQRNINFIFSTSGVDPQTLPGGYAYQYANQSTPHAGGGSFTIPFGGGNESFMMPGGNTASGGETVTITQANRESRTDALLQELINKKMVDENRLARAFLTGLQSVGQ